MLIFTKNNQKISSRQQINIQAIEDDILKLPNNKFRAILSLSAINFELKSDNEQDIVTDIYQIFLNSLPCPIQIYVQIREIDLDRYLSKFNTLLDNENNLIYQSQIKNYIKFVTNLIKTNKILSRYFYIIVPHDSDIGNENIIKEQLELNCEIINKSLSKLGIQSKRLNTIEILDLFYNFYNPNLAKNQPLLSQSINLFQDNYL